MLQIGILQKKGVNYMLIARSILLKDIESKLKKLSVNKNDARKNITKIQNDLYEKYNYPPYNLTAIIQKKNVLEILDDKELYWILSVLDQESVSKYFSEEEIDTYRKEKYSKEKELIEIPGVEVVDKKQWICAVSDAPTFFSELRKNGQVHYNPSAQRAMRIEKLKNGKILWRITLNPVVLQKIRECFVEKKFVPNTITLNINPDSKAHIECENGIVTIRDLDFFDITDGFHRYMALCQEKDLNEDFSYPMEIRITKFYDEKAAYFVWQEDQKTSMSKKDAESYNTETIESKIVNRLNNTQGYFMKKIGRTDEMFNVSDFTECLRLAYKEEIKNCIDSVGFIKEVSADIDRFWDAFDTKNTGYFDNGITIEQLYIMLALSKKEYKAGQARQKMESILKKADKNKLKLAGRTKKSFMTLVEKELSSE